MPYYRQEPILYKRNSRTELFSSVLIVGKKKHVLISKKTFRCFKIGEMKQKKKVSKSEPEDGQSREIQ